MRLEDYLDRIGWTGATEPGIDMLGALLCTHNHVVPFENLDVQLGNSLTTSVEDAYDKIVVRRRGGWCYEQNGLFGWALSEMGFEVRRVAATVMRAHRDANSHANHLTLVVSLPGNASRWLVDVGFGGSLLGPIPLEEKSHYHEPFAVGLRRLDDGHWQFWEKTDTEELSFDFEDAPADEAAMSVRCEYLQTSPESRFVQTLVCQLRRPTAHVVLRGRVFATVSHEHKSQRLLGSADELVSTLSETFNLVMPEVAGLWERVCERHEAFFGNAD